MQSFDDQIREKFSDYTPDVPSHIWENIAARRKKRRFFFWFNLNANISLLLISLALLGGGSFIYNNIKNNTTSPAINKESKNTGYAEQKNKPSSIETQTASSYPANMIAQDIEINNDNSKNQISEGKLSGRKNITSNNFIAGQTPKEAQFSEMNAAYDNSFETPEIKNGNSGKPKSYFTKINIYTSSTLEGNAADQERNKEKEFREIFTPSFNPRRSYSYKLFNPLIQHQDIPCPERDAAGNKKYIEIYGGPDYTVTNFSDTGRSIYLAKRKETTSYSFAYSVGGRYTRVFNNGASIRVGLNYSEIIEKFSQVIGNYTHTEFTIINNQDTIGSYIVSGKLYRTNYNKYNTIDIPLSIGYEFGNGKFHANVNAGTMINIYSWQKGVVIDTAYQAVSITTGDTPSPYQFKSNIGIGFLGSASLYYKLTDRFHIVAEPYFRYNLSTSNKEEITLKQKFHTAGLRLGLRFDLK